MKTKFLGISALLISAFIGGAITPSLIRAGVGVFHPFLFNVLRCAVTSVLFLPWVLYHRKEVFTKDFLKLMLIFGIGCGMNITFFAFGIPHTTLIASQLLYCIIPVTVPLFAYLTHGEKLNSQKTLGALLAIVGVMVLVLFSGSAEQRLALGSLYGNSMILTAVLGYTTFLVYSKKLTQHLSPMLISAATYLGMFFILLPLGIWEIVFGKGFSQATPAVLWPLFWLAIVSLLFMVTLQYGNKKMSSTTVAISVLFAPEFAALTGIFYYHERISWPLIVSLLLVVSGVGLSVVKKFSFKSIE